MVDAERVRALIERLAEYRLALDRLAARPSQELLGDTDLLASVKYHFLVCIECCIDLAHHIIASERFRAPQDYADAFQVLVEAGVLDGNVGERSKSAARFRNRLVHIYWDVDDELVVQYLENERDLFGLFAKAIAAFTSTTAARG